MNISVWIWGLTIVLCALFIMIAFLFRKKSGESFVQYAIAGGTLPFILILFTDIATIMGVGNFVGHSAKGYEIGVANIPFVFGEQGAKVLFALVFAGFAARFTYVTIAEMMDDLILRDRVARALIAVLTSAIMIAWTSGQAIGMGALFSTFTGAEPLPMILLFSGVFIIYTTIGGMYSVVWTDFIQGSLLIGIALWFYYTVFSEVDFSFSTLQTRLDEVGGIHLASLNLSFMEVLSLFVTGVFGVLAAQVYWQRCFAAESPKVASRAMLIGGIVAIVFTSLTTLTGLVIYTKDQSLDPNQAISYFILEELTPVAVLAFFLLVFLAAISSASSLLHAASVVIVNDLVIPNMKKKEESFYVNMTRWCVLLVGVFSVGAALMFESIIDLFSLAYTMAGGGVVPVLIIGLLWKNRKSERFEMGERNSRVTVWGARAGILAGAIVSVAAGILWGVFASAILTILVSLLLPNREEPALSA
ncbi:Pantothenate permease [Bhargavaea cecembensis DSE10]|uniref:Pantothenate permease n=1 Tax=Bhargavaea cecembensis DSE10 TaxID=1235279 RepID=M7NBL9_9BACL|nr:sodium:solute symporter family protein [Bhargavaea cecembensis]EMR05973.1 Pantothenate permease [Bhargavaea cecembensis DSE10]